MTYESLKQLLSQPKSSGSIIREIDSYKVQRNNQKGYIEPNFELSVGSINPSPQILLITASGATGKTALANYLSYSFNLPILDLSVHKAVGEGSFNGLLTTVYGFHEAGNISQLIKDGNFTIIIESVDEGRLKTTEEGLTAFINNIAEYAKISKKVSFILFGRFQNLEHIWLQLSNNGVNSALLEIQAFNEDQAKIFIDRRVLEDPVVGIRVKPFIDQYRKIRDYIVNALRIFFDSQTEKEAYQKFIGYAPVLESISGLLKTDLNYHKLYEEFSKRDYKENEVKLLFDVVERIMLREQEEKIFDKFLPTLVMNEKEKEIAYKQCYSPVEQCSRLLQYLVTSNHEFLLFDTNLELQIKYEDGMNIWIAEHPFIHNQRFQNIVFEAYCLALIMNNENQELRKVVLNYLNSSKYIDNQLLSVFFEKKNTDSSIYKKYIPFFINSVKLMDSKNIYTEISLDSEDPDDIESGKHGYSATLEVYTKYFGKETTSNFETYLLLSDTINFKGYLRDTYITIPCNLALDSKGESLTIGPGVSIRAKEISILCTELITGKAAFETPQEEYTQSIIIDCHELISNVQRVNEHLSIEVYTNSDVAHPLNKYIRKKDLQLRITDDIQKKFKRMRRIILALRSHSRGSLARYKAKIDHNRVLKNQIGEQVLAKLLKDKILESKGNFYHWNPENASQRLGIKWSDMRDNVINEKLLSYLSNI